MLIFAKKIAILFERTNDERHRLQGILSSFSTRPKGCDDKKWWGITNGCHQVWIVNEGHEQSREIAPRMVGQNKSNLIPLSRSAFACVCFLITFFNFNVQFDSPSMATAKRTLTSTLVKTIIDRWDRLGIGQLTCHGTMWPGLQNANATRHALVNTGDHSLVISIVVRYVSCYWEHMTECPESVSPSIS